MTCVAYIDLKFSSYRTFPQSFLNPDQLLCLCQKLFHREVQVLNSCRSYSSAVQSRYLHKIAKVTIKKLTFLEETTLLRCIKPRIQMFVDESSKMWCFDTFTTWDWVLFKPFLLFHFIIDLWFDFLLLDFYFVAFCLVSKHEIGWLFWHVSNLYHVWFS